MMKVYPPILLLAAWTIERQRTLIDSLPRQSFTDGQIIVERHDPSYEVYFILSGSVKAVNFSSTGTVTYFRTRPPGDCFGYYSGISGRPRTATEIAIGSVELARMEGSAFFDLVTDNPEIAKPFTQLLIRLLRLETNRLTGLTILPTHQRVAAALIVEFENQNTLKLILPERVEFAGYLGMTRETLARSLSTFVRQKLITIEGRFLTIVNLQQLTHIAHETEQED